MHGLFPQEDSRWFTLPLAVALLVLLAACGGDGGGSSSGGSGGGGGSPPPIDVSKLTPSCFVGGETAQIDNTAPIPAWTWNDPHVLKVGSKYWMYASSTDNFDFPVRLYRLISDDGETWTMNPATQILADAAPLTWDAGGWETPAVVYFKGKYHLFYTGYPIPVDELGHDPFDYAVGHATSTNGKTFTRVGANPVVAPSGEADDGDMSNDWYAFIVGEPGPVVYNGKLYLYFTAVGLDYDLLTTLQVVGFVSSTDGTTWSAPQLALKPDQTQFPRIIDPGPPVAGWVGYSTPNAIVLNNQMHLFYDVAYDADGSSWKQIRLHHSYSLDGETDWVQDTAPMFSAPWSDWGTEEVRSSDALLDGQTLRFYFAGHTVPAYNFSIGEATCDLTPD